MARGCSKTETPCNLEQFMRYTSIYSMRKIKTPGRGTQRSRFPKYDLVDWSEVGEGDDLRVFNTQLEKSGFNGDFDYSLVFRDPVSNGIEGAFEQAEKIARQSIAKLKNDGKDVTNNERIRKMQIALQTHADARRCDIAKKICAEFERVMSTMGLPISYTEPISRPPVPEYRKIDMDRTIEQNRNNPEFKKYQKKIVAHIDEYNTGKDGLAHLKALKVTVDLHRHVAEACRANNDILHGGI